MNTPSSSSLSHIAWQHLQKLAGEIGARPGGSPANQAAAEYIRQQFERCGLEVEMQSFACPSWEDQGARANEFALELDGEMLPAYTNSFSPACDVTAKLLPVGTVAELEQAELAGRLVVLYGDLTSAVLSPKSWFLKSEREDRIITLLESGQPAAILTVQNRLGSPERLIEDWEFHVPSATVTPEVGLKLLRQPDAKAHLQLDTCQKPGQTANVIGRIRGSRADKIVLCAHYDTKFGTPGASDNGGGVAVLLSLAETLAQAQLPLSLEFVAFTNEEYLPIGDTEYLLHSEAEFDQLLAVINFDGVGASLGSNNITAIAGSSEFEALAREIAHHYPGVVWVEPWPEGNHSSFSWRGIPCLAFSNWGTLALAHQPEDTPAWMNPDKLAEVILVASDIIKAWQDKPIRWARQAQA